MPDLLPDLLLVRAFLASTELLLDVDRGITPCRLDGETATPILYEGDGSLYVFYEVASFGSGSWWVPVSTEPSTQWQGYEPLQAEGDIATTAVQRASRLLWWVPPQTLEPDIRPITVFGKILGDWPTAPLPPNAAPSRKRKR